jgi:Tol biopolymer transport system component
MLVGAALLCACTGAGSSTAVPSAPSASVTPRPGPLTGQLAFAGSDPSLGPGHEQIYLEQADGSHVRQLVRSAASDTNPALSPDGRRLVFTRHVPGAPDRIFLVGVDGTGLRALAPANCPGVCSDAVEGPAWSPDGRRLVFTRALLRGHSLLPTARQVWVADADGSGAHRVTQEPAGSADGSASWAPDGTRILFTRHVRAVAPNPDQFAVYVVDVNGSDLRQVTPNDIEAGEAVWSPDGALIAIQSPPDDEAFPKALFTIRPDGTGMHELTDNLDANDSDGPTWSPDGRRIAFSHVPAGSSGGADLYVVDRDGSAPHPLAVTPLSETRPSWAVAPTSG